jgi:SAM-dependent methyltransferase
MGVDYQHLAESYDRHRALDPSIAQRWLDNAIRLMALPRGGRILDLGCGTGRLLHPLSAQGFWVVGIDASNAMLRRLLAKGGRARVVRANLSLLPFRDRTFDGGIASFVLHHVDDWRRALAEASRVCRGLAVITSDMTLHRDDILYRAFPRILEIDSERFPALGELRAHMESMGFQGMEVRGLDGPRSLSREQFLKAVGDRYISTCSLLSEGEFRRGLDRLQKELEAKGIEEVSRPSRVVVLGGYR